MSLRTTIEVVTRLSEQGVLQSYAIAGAVAALNYIQPMLTEDLDILVSIGDFETRTSGLILLTPIEQALAKMGYAEHLNEGIMIDGWPVQFLPASSPLDEEGLREAVEVDIDSTGEAPLKARCLRAEHVVATAVSLGRLKDFARIEAFLDVGSVDLRRLKSVLERHHLMSAWRGFCAKAGKPDPLE